MDSSPSFIDAVATLTQDEKNTQLLNAAKAGDIEKVGVLLQAGANIEATNRFGNNTALMLAARENHQDAAFLILRAMSPKSRAAVKFGQGGCALNRRLAANPVAGLPLGMRQWLQVLKGRYVKCTNFSVIHLGLWWMLFL